jgi:hypothetical protein
MGRRRVGVLEGGKRLEVVVPETSSASSGASTIHETTIRSAVPSLN